ncbi:uncharacterized protein PADG_07265 [Paracoccidioides brasiliensis Pb18]|uniref:Uncharacterized protein n=1 Tax=Paracoccidioides brasiliensis (strain Pb18) TaxID=502780 RepID=C1GJ29_PARBD|nr:uncharacterized protein PADG_07265 [Paracoccidioides brasiliensis Pb18]EEH42445.1 hypothetical protein PADG_07265 [Paracoccidioides brasiliensis Pb18]
MLATYPTVIWAGFIGSPYNFNMSNVGNTNFSSFICGVLGMLWDGYASDWCILFLSRRNKGILEPEFKFWTMLVPALINTGRLLMHGLGVFNGVMWFLPVGFGMDSVAFGIGSGGAIAITYAVYCYPHIASDSLALMLLIRNKIGCGFAFTSQSWLDHNGLKDTTIIMAMICLMSNMSFLPLI